MYVSDLNHVYFVLYMKILMCIITIHIIKYYCKCLVKFKLI